jgi:hypothetical protein
MLRSQKPGNNGSGEMDEHNQPTEPMPPLVLPASPAGVPGMVSSMPSPADPTLAMPPAYGMPNAYPYPSPAQYPVQGGQQAYPVYPILPPQPAQQHIPMTGNATGSQFHPGEALGQFLKITFWIIFTQRRLIPLLVGGLFVVVELGLLARAILALIGRFTFIPRQIALEAISDVFLVPIQLLVQVLHLPVPIGIEISCLLALPLYLLLSRLLVRTLKVLLGVHKQQATSTSGKANQKP